MDLEQAKLVIDIETTSEACAGAAAAFLMRHIAARAGTYAPGIQERLFFDLSRRANGRDLEQVERWFAANSGELSRLGYRLLWRHVVTPTEHILAWVDEGDGWRGAVLPTDVARLHKRQLEIAHAVAVTRHHDSAPTSGSTAAGLIVADPLPGIDSRVAPPSPALELAHRHCKYQAMLVFWAGYA